MPDYQKMYGIMMRATEQALRILIEAQQTCEEIYLSEAETNISLFPKNNADERTAQGVGSDESV